MIKAPLLRVPIQAQKGDIYVMLRARSQWFGESTAQAASSDALHQQLLDMAKINKGLRALEDLEGIEAEQVEQTLNPDREAA